MPDLQTAPSLYAAILFHSRLNPFATAVVMESGDVSYRAFCADIERVTSRLHRQAFPSGAIVNVQVRNQYLRWLAIIALARLGVVSISPTTAESKQLGATFAVCDRPGEATGDGIVEIEINASWLESAPDGELPVWQDIRHHVDAPCRLVLSSGTTGVPKRAVLTYGQIRARIRGNVRSYGLNSSARIATAMGTGTVGGFMMLISCWSTGGAVLLQSPVAGQPGREILSLHPNVIMLSPQQLGRVVSSLPRERWSRERLAVYVAGSALPPALSRAARLRLSEVLFIIYGSTEAGSVTMTHASAADGRPGFSGYVLPTAQVEIVDEDGRPVAVGETGEVRIRAEGMVDGYADAEDTESPAFRDGWFFPGDLGFLSNDGSLTLVGRKSELMNFGGSKLAPERIERALASCAGVTEMAAFSVTGPAGAERPCLAVVSGSGFDEQAVLREFRKAFPALPALTVFQVEALPRNEMGKVLRNEMSARAQQMLHAPAAAIGRPVTVQ
jgi:acyl-coenzyme A synthetase/AMP-(fatty) acid ligase